MHSVDREVVVKSQHLASGHLFGKPHHAGISEVHWHIGISDHQLLDALDLLLKAKGDLQGAPSDELKDRFNLESATTEDKTSLRQNGFAGEKRRFDFGELLPRPAMVTVSTIQQGNKRTRVAQDPLLH